MKINSKFIIIFYFWVFIFGFIPLIIGTGGCSGKTRTLTLAGSTAFQPFAEKLAEVYMKTNPGILINVQGGGSFVGIQSVLDGVADIGMADLVGLPKEARKLHSMVVARDGIAVIVNPKNRVRNLTVLQIKKIFTGKISNWKVVGGRDAKIIVISREEGSGTRSSFESLMLKGERLASNALFQDSNGVIRESVASDPNAISYLSIGFVNEKVAIVSIDGVQATNANVRRGTYKISRPIFFLTKDKPYGLSADFIKFVLGKESQAIIEKEGLIRIK